MGLKRESVPREGDLIILWGLLGGDRPPYLLLFLLQVLPFEGSFCCPLGLDYFGGAVGLDYFLVEHVPV